jgi:hypothetical protein
VAHDHVITHNRLHLGAKPAGKAEFPAITASNGVPLLELVSEMQGMGKEHSHQEKRFPKASSLS